MNNPPTKEDFKKIYDKLQENKAKVSYPVFAIIRAEDLMDLMGGNFEIEPGTHIEKDGCNIFVS